VSAQKMRAGCPKDSPRHVGRAVLVGMMVFGHAAWAVTPVINPATTVEQQNRARVLKLGKKSAVQQTGPVVISPARVRAGQAAPGGPTVLLSKVEFVTVSAFLSEQDLAPILGRYIGTRVDFSKIQQLVQDINDLYTKKGIVTASAILPPQTLTRGVLKVRLVEGKLATVSVSGARQVPEDFVLKRVTLTTGDNVVDVPQAARDITHFNKVYDAKLRMSLRPGQAYGTTDVALALTEPRKNQLSFFLDNQGVESTGKTEVGIYFHRYGLWATDDNLLAYGTRSEGSVSGTLTYDAPITPIGTRLSLSYSQSYINVVSGPTKPLDISGRSHSLNATLKQALLVKPHWALFGTGNLSYGVSKSWAAAVPLVDSYTSRASLGLLASYTGTKGSFAIQPQVVFADVTDKLEPSNRVFKLFTGSFNGVYQFANGLMLSSNGAWQYTYTKLVQGDMLFQVGGPATVRGYPTDAASGDSGFFGQFEAHKSFDKVKPGLDAFGFFDAGGVYSTFPASQIFLSAGVGVAYPVSDKVKLEIEIGIPLRQVVPHQSSATVYARLTVAAF